LPLYESLSALEEKYRAHKAHEVLLDFCDSLRFGRPFSEALARHETSFDLLYQTMIAGSEQSGNLVKALDELARLIERQLELKKQLVAVLLYPSLLASFCLIVLMTLLFFVVPSLADLFEGRDLHPFTRFVFACSSIALKGKWVLAMVGASAIAAIFWAVTSKRIRYLLRNATLRLPFWKELSVKIALARFFRAAAALLEGGLPAVTALRESKMMLNHSVLEQVIGEALSKIAEGASLQEALQDRPLIPPLVSRMLGIAQTSGNLSSMMHQIASIYEEDLERSFSRLTALAQPILLLILGGMVGFVLLSVLLPLTDVNSFAT
jgi:general secretion pathway protein F/type IV pilus assembly protein PilC